MRVVRFVGQLRDPLTGESKHVELTGELQDFSSAPVIRGVGHVGRAPDDPTYDPESDPLDDPFPEERR